MLLKANAGWTSGAETIFWLCRVPTGQFDRALEYSRLNCRGKKERPEGTNENTALLNVKLRYSTLKLLIHVANLHTIHIKILKLNTNLPYGKTRKSVRKMFNCLKFFKPWSKDKSVLNKMLVIFEGVSRIVQRRQQLALVKKIIFEFKYVIKQFVTDGYVIGRNRGAGC